MAPTMSSNSLIPAIWLSISVRRIMTCLLPEVPQPNARVLGGPPSGVLADPPKDLLSDHQAPKPRGSAERARRRDRRKRHPPGREECRRGYLRPRRAAALPVRPRRGARTEAGAVPHECAVHAL